MKTSTLVKSLGTSLAATLTASVPMLHEPYNLIAAACAAALVSWLHLPRPGDVKGSDQ